MANNRGLISNPFFSTNEKIIENPLENACDQKIAELIVELKNTKSPI